MSPQAKDKFWSISVMDIIKLLSIFVLAIFAYKDLRSDVDNIIQRRQEDAVRRNEDMAMFKATLDDMRDEIKILRRDITKILLETKNNGNDNER